MEKEKKEKERNCLIEERIKKMFFMDAKKIYGHKFSDEEIINLILNYVRNGEKI